jgi:hypothetical protein
MPTPQITQKPAKACPSVHADMAAHTGADFHLDTILHTWCYMREVTWETRVNDGGEFVVVLEACAIKDALTAAPAALAAKTRSHGSRTRYSLTELQTTIWTPKCSQVNGMLIHDGRGDEEEGISEQQNHACGLKKARITFYLMFARRSHERLSSSSHSPRSRKTW